MIKVNTIECTSDDISAFIENSLVGKKYIDSKIVAVPREIEGQGILYLVTVISQDI